MTSIAFPVIGTGKFGFPHTTASNIMLQEAVQFCQTNQSSSIKDVRFVVYKKDQALITAFKQEMAAMQGNYGAGVRPVIARGGSFGPTGGRNFNVRVTQGDITQEQTDAIVNINSTDMNMYNAGALSKAIVKASGSVVETECRNMGQQAAGAAVMTSGGNLAVRHIIHSVPGSGNKQHLQCVENCLRKADASGLRSVSLPAFGTGAYGMSAQDSAELTFQALDKFCPTSQNVRQVNVVIFQPGMLQTFTQEQQKRAEALVAPPSPWPVPLPQSVFLKRPKRRGGGGGRHSPPGSASKNDQRVTFCVLGKDEERTKKAIDALKKGLSEACTTQKVEEKAVRLLTEKQMSLLQKRAMSLDVHIEVEAKVNRVVVRGDPNDVATLVGEIWTELNDRKDKERTKEQVKLVSKNVRWHYEMHGTCMPFDKKTNVELEKAHSEDKRSVTVALHGEIYSINLMNKTGAGQNTGNQIKVNRKVLGASVEGTCIVCLRLVFVFVSVINNYWINNYLI